MEEITVAEYRRLIREAKKQVKAAKQKEQAAALASAFETQWRRLGGGELVKEYRFHSGRRWFFDYAAPDIKVAIEVEGGTWVSGRHSRGAGYARDCEKYNNAALLGWTVFRFTTDMIGDDPAGHLGPVIAFINERRNKLGRRI